MFTGIIRHRGTVVSLVRWPRARLIVRIPRLRARRSDSVAVDGVCLTVASHVRATYHFDLLGETLRVTTLGQRRPGDRVNIEPSLRAGDRVGGHLVLGHIDGVGRVVRRRATARGLALTVAVPAALRRFLVPKGAVALDGISLTVAPGSMKATCTVLVIPHTAAVTTLGTRQVGEALNLEVDPLARYAVAAIDAVRP